MKFVLSNTLTFFFSFNKHDKNMGERLLKRVVIIGFSVVIFVVTKFYSDMVTNYGGVFFGLF